MTRVVFCTDIHGNRSAYGELLDHAAASGAGAIVFGGDITPLPPRGDPESIAGQREFLENFMGPLFRDFRAKHLDCPIFTLMGNDDWSVNMDAMEAIEASGAVRLMHMKAQPFVDGLSIAGYTCVPVTPFYMKDWDRFDTPRWQPNVFPKICRWSVPGGTKVVSLDAVRARGTIDADLDMLGAMSDPAETVYVTHTPPYGTKLDVLYDGTPIGSHAVRAFIETRRPPLTLHGHIHESPQMSGSMHDRIGRTVSINPGASIHGLQAVIFEARDPEKTLRVL